MSSTAVILEGFVEAVPLSYTCRTRHGGDGLSSNIVVSQSPLYKEINDVRSHRRHDRTNGAINIDSNDVNDEGDDDDEIINDSNRNVSNDNINSSSCSSSSSSSNNSRSDSDDNIHSHIPQSQFVWSGKWRFAKEKMSSLKYSYRV